MTTFRDYLKQDHHDEYYDADKFPQWVIDAADEIVKLHDNDYHCHLPEPVKLLTYIQKMNLSHLTPYQIAEEFFVDYCDNNKNKNQEYLGF